MVIALSKTAQDLVDLGIPTLIATLLGTILGAVLTYRFGKRLLDDQADRERERLIVQTERDAMTAGDDALHQLSRGVAASTAGETDWPRLHNEWAESVSSAPGRLRDPELRERILTVGWALFTAFQYRDQAPIWLVQEAIVNAREGLQARLRGEPMPPARFPTRDEAFKLMWQDGGSKGNLEALTAAVIERVQAAETTGSQPGSQGS